jgi:hypothetical protein
MTPMEKAVFAGRTTQIKAGAFLRDDEWLEFLTAALAALEAEGWVLVPVEPTDEMVAKAISSTSSHLDLPGSKLMVNREKARIRYRAMIAAFREATTHDFL